MSHSLTKIWVHVIWATKLRQPFIKSSVEKKVYEFIRTELSQLNCPVKIINGMPDHIHCLFLLNPQKSLADVIKQIKGSSSHFINKNDLITEKFSWQTGYAAFAVSQSSFSKCNSYIQHQKEHHSKKTFEKEYNDFLIAHELENIDNNKSHG